MKTTSCICKKMINYYLRIYIFFKLLLLQWHNPVLLGIHLEISLSFNIHSDYVATSQQEKQHYQGRYRNFMGSAERDFTYNALRRSVANNGHTFLLN